MKFRVTAVRASLASLALLATLAHCFWCEGAWAQQPEQSTPDMVITSDAFGDGQAIPKRYTCDGENISPPIAWSGIPSGTKTFAVVSEDADAPRGVFVHWVIFNIPSKDHGLPEAVPARPVIESGARNGVNDFGSIGYGGPCPPRGVHRYYFRVYALDREMALEPGADKNVLKRAMEGHVIGEGQLLGMYGR